MSVLARTPMWFPSSLECRLLARSRWGRESERVGLGSVWTFTRHLSELLYSVSLCYALHVDRLLVRSFCLFRQELTAGLKRGIFLYCCQFVAPASCAACVVVHSYTLSFKGVYIVLFSESHTAHLTRPLRLRLARSHTDATLSCCLMSLCGRKSSVSLTCFHLHMLPLLLLAALHACSRRFKGEILLNSFFGSLLPSCEDFIWGVGSWRYFFLKKRVNSSGDR